MKYITVMLPQKCFRKMANNIINIEYNHCLCSLILAQESTSKPKLLVGLL